MYTVLTHGIHEIHLVKEWHPLWNTVFSASGGDTDTSSKGILGILQGSDTHSTQLLVLVRVFFCLNFICCDSNCFPCTVTYSQVTTLSYWFFAGSTLFWTNTWSWTFGWWEMAHLAPTFIIWWKFILQLVFTSTESCRTGWQDLTLYMQYTENMCSMPHLAIKLWQRQL